MTDREVCIHLELKKLAEGSPSNLLHRGPEKAYYCHECGSTFFVLLKPAEIQVSYGLKQEQA